MANVGQRVHFSQGVVWVRKISRLKKTEKKKKIFSRESDSKRYVFPTFVFFYQYFVIKKKKFVEDTLLCSKWYPNAQLKHLRKNAFQYYKLWVNDTKNDKVPKINVTTEDINDNLDELGYHGTIGITSKHLLLRNFLRSKGVRVLEARFGSFVPTKLRTEIPTTIRQATYYVEKYVDCRL